MWTTIRTISLATCLIVGTGAGGGSDSTMSPPSSPGGQHGSTSTGSTGAGGSTSPGAMTSPGTGAGTGSTGTNGAGTPPQ